MPESLNKAPATASNLESKILRRVASLKNSTIAGAIGHDESHISRIMSGERGIRICEMYDFFTTLGMRVIECDGAVVAIPAAELEAYKILARKALV